MKQRIAHIALVVKEYDEAIEFYTKKLDFTLLEDTKIDEDKRQSISLITQKGRDLLIKMDDSISRADNTILEKKLTDKECVTLSNILEKIYE